MGIASTGGRQDYPDGRATFVIPGLGRARSGLGRARSALNLNLHRLPAGRPELLRGSDQPPGLGKPLRAGLEGSHSARRGDYRVVYAIREATHLVQVEHIDRRSDVYR